MQHRVYNDFVHAAERYSRKRSQENHSVRPCCEGIGRIGIPQLPRDHQPNLGRTQRAFEGQGKEKQQVPELWVDRRGIVEAAGGIVQEVEGPVAQYQHRGQERVMRPRYTKGHTHVIQTDCYESFSCSQDCNEGMNVQ